MFKGKEGMQEVKGGPSIGHHPFFCWLKRLPKKGPSSTQICGRSSLFFIAKCYKAF